MLRATFKSFVRHLTKFDKSKKIYRNGAENNYPEFMEAVRCGSVTASMASEIMSQYIIGKGFGEFDNFEFDGVKVHEFTEDLTNDIVNNKGCFIQVDYDLEYNISNYKLLPFSSCRVGQKDSNEFSGKILYCPDWADQKIKAVVFDAFNPNRDIVKAQIDKAGSIEKYKGQIMFYSLDRRRVYPLHRLDSVYKECENEDLSSTYKNTVIKRGFFGKTLVVTRPLVDDGLRTSSDAEDIKEYHHQETERTKFKDTIEEFIGADNAGGVMHMELEFESDKLEDAVLFKNIESNIDPDMFKTVEDTACTKILMVYKNLPIALVKSPDSAMFGNSGEAIEAAQKMYQKNLYKERNIIETIINDLWKLHRDFDKKYKSLIPLIDEKVSDDTGLQDI